MNETRNNRNAPLIIVDLENYQRLCENVIAAANTAPNVQLIDPFVELKGCSWCHRRIGDKNLVRGICPNCLLSVRGAGVIAGRVCSECKGVQ